MAKHRIQNKRKQDLIFYVVMLAYPVLQFAIFYVGVNVNSVLMAFQEYSGKGDSYLFLAGERIFQNFKDVFYALKTETVFPFAFKNSLIAYATGLIVSTSLSLIFSYYIFKKFPLHGLMKVVLFTPSVISGIILVSIFMEFVEVVIPTVFFDITQKEIEGFLSNTSTRFGAILFFCVWMGFGGSILLYVGAMNNISDSVIEACRLDGANTLQEIIYIVLPLIYPTFVTFIVVGVGGILTNQMALYSFYGASAKEYIQTFGYYFFNATKAAGYKEYPFLASMGILMTLIIAPLTLFVKWGLEKIGPKQD
ncbi:MAG: sugar ABC transporter permease [Clostridia bacterium]|nr:sugar ABC transporter permease [Clostridia bacterium]